MPTYRRRGCDGRYETDRADVTLAANADFITLIAQMSS